MLGSFEDNIRDDFTTGFKKGQALAFLRDPEHLVIVKSQLSECLDMAVRFSLHGNQTLDVLEGVFLVLDEIKAIADKYDIVINWSVAMRHAFINRFDEQSFSIKPSGRLNDMIMDLGIDPELVITRQPEKLYDGAVSYFNGKVMLVALSHIFSEFDINRCDKRDGIPLIAKAAYASPMNSRTMELMMVLGADIEFDTQNGKLFHFVNPVDNDAVEKLIFMQQLGFDVVGDRSIFKPHRNGMIERPEGYMSFVESYLLIERLRIPPEHLPFSKSLDNVKRVKDYLLKELANAEAMRLAHADIATSRKGLSL